MSDKAEKAAGHGLLFDLPGAPATPHVLPDLFGGEFNPGEPRSLEELGISLAEAKKLDAAEGVPLKLVSLKKKEA